MYVIYTKCWLVFLGIHVTGGADGTDLQIIFQGYYTIDCNIITIVISIVESNNMLICKMYPQKYTKICSFFNVNTTFFQEMFYLI